MFKGYKQLSDKERLILVQLPLGKQIDNPGVDYVEYEFPLIRESAVRENSGLPSKVFHKTVKDLIGRGLLKRGKDIFNVSKINWSTRIVLESAYGLGRTSKSARRVRKIFL